MMTVYRSAITGRFVSKAYALVHPATTYAFKRESRKMPEPGSEEWRKILCNGPIEDIPDDDPGLALFTEGSVEDRKIALAIERANSCDEEN